MTRLATLAPAASVAKNGRGGVERHLDEPIVVQYGYWLKDFVTFDMGLLHIQSQDVIADVQRQRDARHRLFIGVLGPSSSGS